MRFHFAFFAVTAAVGLLASPASALTPISGFTQARVQAFVDYGAVSYARQRVASWNATPQDLNLTVTVAAAYQPNDLSLSQSDVAAIQTARWSPDGSSGRVSFDWAWRFAESGVSETPDPQVKGGAFDGLNPNWSYTFRADRNGLLRWEGQVRPAPTNITNNTFGLSGWNLQLNGATVIDLFDPFGAGPRTGDMDFALVGGETYTFSLVNRSNIAGSNFGGYYQGTMLGEFGWEIVEMPHTAVPEPTTWALMICGFGLAGAALRRRRTDPRRLTVA